MVETSVVVAVIGLLSAIAIPSFSAVRTHSLDTIKQSNVRVLNNAVQQWAMENFSSDDERIGGGITNYIKGGLSRLAVGSAPVNITNIVSKTAGYTFTVEDLY
ncbi:MAG: hypothetical protein K9L89_01640 [Kiritimatiellales bacterium]|nr:hypothetical protein [Kiritimatiellales bacterium]